MDEECEKVSADMGSATMMFEFETPDSGQNPTPDSGQNPTPDSGQNPE
jgi:hypothetical protein